MWEFSDKGWNVKGLNKVLQKLRDSGGCAMTTAPETLFWLRLL